MKPVVRHRLNAQSSTILTCFGRLSASVLLATAFISPALTAQSARFSGAITTLTTGVQAGGVALDPGGNLFFTEQGSGSIKELFASTGYTTGSTIATGLSTPSGIAIDAAGNLYVAETGTSAVKQLLASGGYLTVNTLGSGFGAPTGLALDPAGNIFVTDQGDGSLKEIMAATGYTTVVPVATGFAQPSGLAVDSAANVFMVDSGSGIVREFVASSGYSSVNVIATLSAPAGIAVDIAGNLFITDSISSTVTELSGTGYAVQTQVGAGFNAPGPIAANAAAGLVVANLGNTSMVQLVLGGIDAGISPVASRSPRFSSFIFTFDSSTVINAPAVLTQGSPNLDFADLGTGTCTTNGSSYAYSFGDTCSVDVSFTPGFPGSRYGAVILSDTSSNTLATGYLYGTGTGPQGLFFGAALTQIDPTLNAARAVAVDSAGNLFVVDSTNGTLIKEHAGVPSIITTSTLSSPSAVAVDGAGAIYIADTGNNRVLKQTPSAGAYVETVVSSTVSNPAGVAVDGSGSVYISDTGNNRILKETLTPTGYAEAVFATSSLSSPTGLASDAQGRIYIADTGNSRVIIETPAPLGYVETTLGSGLSAPSGVTVVGGGSVLIADAGSKYIVAEILTGASYAQAVMAATSGVPTGVAVSAAGDVYIAAGALQSLRLSVPPSFFFPSTAQGAGSSGQTAYLTNIGNAALTFPTPLSGYNPSIAANFSLDSSSGSSCPLLSSRSTPAALSPGAFCTLNVSFVPSTPGSISGALVLTDDNLNVPSATQTIPLSGTATLPVPSITFTVADHIYGDAAFSLSASSASTGAFTYTLVSGPATLSGDSITVTGTGLVTVSVAQAADSNYDAATATTTFTVNKATPTVTFGETDKTFGDSAFTVAASSPSPGAFTYSVLSGPVTVSGDSVTITGTGVVLLRVSQAATANYNAANQTAAFTVNTATPTLTFTVADKTFGNAPFNVSASSASTGAITYSLVSGSASVSGDTVTLTGAGSVTLLATQAADTNYTSATQTVTFNVAKATPTVTFTVADKTFGDSAFNVSASSASTGAITYSVVSGPASVFGDTVTLTGAGSVTLLATQAADTNYTSATQTVTFNVAKATPTVTFTVADKTFGDSAFNVSASSASTGAITYSLVSGSASVSGDTVTLTGAGSVTLLATQAADSNYTSATQTVTFNVAKATPTVTFTVADKTFGDSAFNVSASSASTGAITYSLVSGPASVSGDTVTLTGAGSVTLLATQAADSNYTANTQTVTFNIAKASAPLTFTIADKIFGDIPFTLAATSASTGAITYTVTSGPATFSSSLLSLTGAGSVTVLASRAADADHTAATQSVTFNVAAATPTLTFTVADHTFGDAPFNVSASSASAAAITYAVVSGPATISGSTVTLTGAGAVVLSATQAAATDYTSATQNATFNTAVGTTALTFTVSNRILGDAPFSVSATSASTGVITYALVSGPATISGGLVTLTGAGTVVLTATQAADGNYSATTQNATFSIMARTIWVAGASSNLSAFDVSGSAVSGSSGYTGGGLGSIAFPLGMAFDHANAIWVANMSGGVSKFNADGTAVGTGFSGGGIVNPHAIAVDGDGQVWTANNNGSVSALTNSGSAITPGTGYTGSGLGTPGAIAVDLSGNVWVTNTTDDSVTELIGVAAPAAPLSAALTAATTGARP